MFYTLIINPEHADCKYFIDTELLSKNPSNKLLKLSEFIHYSSDKKTYIFYVDTDFSDKKIHGYIEELFQLAKGSLTRLNVLNVNFTVDDIEDYLDDNKYLDNLFIEYI